jgi:YihY family inner membrane protein
MAVAGLLLIAFVLANVFLVSARVWLQQFPEVDPNTLTIMHPAAALGIQFALSTVAFTLIYRYLPLQYPPWRVALGGGIVAAILWHVASPVFTYTMMRSQLYGASYGGLAGVVIFALWALLWGWVLLLGAHLAAAHDHVFIQRKPPSDDDDVIGWPGKFRGGKAPEGSQ